MTLTRSRLYEYNSDIRMDSESSPKKNSDKDLQDSALEPDPNELARELVGVALMHRTRLRRGW